MADQKWHGVLTDLIDADQLSAQGTTATDFLNNLSDADVLPRIKAYFMDTVDRFVNTKRVELLAMFAASPVDVGPEALVANQDRLLRAQRYISSTTFGRDNLILQVEADGLGITAQELSQSIVAAGEAAPCVDAHIKAWRTTTEASINAATTPDEASQNYLTGRAGFDVEVMQAALLNCGIPDYVTDAISAQSGGGDSGNGSQEWQGHGVTEWTDSNVTSCIVQSSLDWKGGQNSPENGRVHFSLKFDNNLAVDRKLIKFTLVEPNFRLYAPFANSAKGTFTFEANTHAEAQDDIVITMHTWAHDLTASGTIEFPFQGDIRPQAFLDSNPTQEQINDVRNVYGPPSVKEIKIEVANV